MYDYIKTIIPEERILFHEPMSKHTTFRVGGEADCLIMIHEEQELTKLIRYLNQIEEAYFIVGNGSNLLVGDKDTGAWCSNLTGLWEKWRRKER